jgi:hypothetical protein
VSAAGAIAAPREHAHPRRRVTALVLCVLVIAAAAAFLAVDRPWSATARAEAVTVVRSRLLPGRILLTVRNGEAEPVRIAQVIVNDAFQTFRPVGPVRPGASRVVAVDYPWIEGEAYEIELLTTTGATIEVEVDDASASATR